MIFMFLVLKHKSVTFTNSLSHENFAILWKNIWSMCIVSRYYEQKSQFRNHFWTSDKLVWKKQDKLIW